MNKKIPNRIIFNSIGDVTADAINETRLLSKVTRSGKGDIDPLLKGVKIDQVFKLGAKSRGDTFTPQQVETSDQNLLAIETEDGDTLFIRVDKLAEDIERIRPEAVRGDNSIDFEAFRDLNTSNRGLGDFLWKSVSVIRLPDDGLADEALALAKKWAKDTLVEKAVDTAYDVGSFLGAKALMRLIENRLAGYPGLYEWKGKNLSTADRCLPDNLQLMNAAQGLPALLLIHGTASHTQGSFDDLRQDADSWKTLTERYPGGIFGYEHRTFSESPIENALELVNALPANAVLSVLTHSRGGLVGDLLCLGHNIPDHVVDFYSIDKTESKDLKGLEAEEQEERTRLRELMRKLRDKNIVVERYVRVACPARGTRLLSDNLDVALSDLATLLQKTGSALASVVAGMVGGPVAAKTVGKGASSALGVLKRLALEIAGRRIDPKLIPGIAAMRIDSPISAFLAHPEVRHHDRTRIALIAGDTEFDSFGFSTISRRLANLFCDWRLFDQQDNDMVVDTDSMYAGLGFGAGVKYLFDQSSEVTHFRYFTNPTSRTALVDWFTQTDTTALNQFLPLNDEQKISWQERDKRIRARGARTGPRPVAILIPGIMGTHIEIKQNSSVPRGGGNRIWLEPVSLARGDIDLISNPKSSQAFAEDLFESFYGDMAEQLQETHEVIRCPYDWRKPVEECAQTLADSIEQALEQFPNQPVRLLAHSMGGLVARTFIHQNQEIWDKIIKSGGRLVMLGTPNQGAHMMVHTLLGKNTAIRMLATADLKPGHDLQYLLNIIRQFPGALSLLPNPDFRDVGAGHAIPSALYYDTAKWQELKQKNCDFWYDDQIAGIPDDEMLVSIKKHWKNTIGGNQIQHPEQVHYIFGQGKQTACGVVDLGQRLQLLFTREGDGTVTWESGKLGQIPEENYKYIPVEHGDLLNAPDYFDGIIELLETGKTTNLPLLPKRRGEETETFVLDAPPPVIPNSREIMRAVMGSTGIRPRLHGKPLKILQVSATSGDLRFCLAPVLCGHYYGDVISGAEYIIDHYIVEGRLNERLRLGMYADDVGTSTLVLMPLNSEEKKRQTRRGALIVGLGEMTGRLSSTEITKTVRSGVLKLLLREQEVSCDNHSGVLKINSLLIGQNSSAQISISESIVAIVRGICEANAKFNSDSLFVGEVEFIDLYRDNAITAAHVIRDLKSRMKRDSERFGIQIESKTELKTGTGCRERLWSSNDTSYWPRLIVNDASSKEEPCINEQKQLDDLFNSENLSRILSQLFDLPESEVRQKLKKKFAQTNRRKYPNRLRYIFVSERARSESIAFQRQPGLIEAIVEEQLKYSRYNAQLSRILFELMIPLDYKATAREVDNLVLLVDSYTANLPWELLQAENSTPMVSKTAMVRQFATTNFRRNVRTTPSKTACIIADPSTEGYAEYFETAGGEDLPQLDGAKKEGAIIRNILNDSNSGFSGENINVSPPGAEALNVLALLMNKPYRLLAIAAHGVNEIRHIDGEMRTGVVLSGGALITAAEIGQMEVVPELVFINCCHLGTISADAGYNRLAYSLSRELIEMGVRCIVAAGWAVDDEAACTFSETFFTEMVIEKKCFGDAIQKARLKTLYRHRETNTWGAYQAYGDPGYRLDPDKKGRSHKINPFVSIDELLQKLDDLRTAINDDKSRKKQTERRFNKQKVDYRIDILKKRAQQGWLDKPEVLEALGKIYADLGGDCFEIARNFYLKAISQEDKSGIVAITTIEQLANLEVRQGEKKANRDLIESGINRLKLLLKITDSDQKTEINRERYALLGSAYKKLAAYGISKPGRKWAWKRIVETLKSAAEAYQIGTQPRPEEHPYYTLNYLQCTLLTIPPEKHADLIKLAKLCGETARKDFQKDGDFWNAVMSADAEMTAWLAGAKLPPIELDGKTIKEDFEILERIYRDSIKGVPATDRHMDSVTTNFKLFSMFLKERGEKGDVDRANILDSLVGKL